jgi:SNF2 family DNA or RNA helicase
VALDNKHTYYNRARIVVRSLLTSSEYGHDKFHIGYEDLGFLRYKLDMLGLVGERTISPEALNRVNWLHSIQVKNENLKQGMWNEETKLRLQGKLKTTLYEDQVSAVSYLVHNRRAGLFDCMGFGKSFCSLATTIALGSEISKTLIVCPRSVMIGFEREILKHTFLRSISVPRGRKEALEFIRANCSGEWDIMLIHPENLINSAKGATKYMGETTKLLKTLIWDQVVIDEFHMYKNVEAKRSKCVKALINESRGRDGKSPRAVLMTGTPVSENPTSAYMVLSLLGKESMPHISTFENYFCIKKRLKISGIKKGGLKKGERLPKPRFINKVVGFKNLGELKVMIEAVSIRRTKDDVTGFPDQISVIRNIELSGKQRSLYRLICGQIIKDLPAKNLINLKSFLETGNKVLRLRQIMNSPALLEEGGKSAKYEELDSILEELLADGSQKVVIWTEWRAAVDLLYERYNTLYGAAKLYGGVTNLELEKLRDDFELKEKPRVIISIPAKGGTGLDFLARARTAIYVDRPRSYILYNQSLDRICRRIPPGDNLSELDKIRSKPATLIFLDVVHSVDEMIREELWGKVSFVDAVTIRDDKLVELGKQDLLKYLK